MLKERSRKFKEQVLAWDLFPNRDVTQISPNEPPEAQLKHRCWIRRQRSWSSPRRRKRPHRLGHSRMCDAEPLLVTVPCTSYCRPFGRDFKSKSVDRDGSDTMLTRQRGRVRLVW